jgi:DNA-binding NtrC family response regulator
MGYDYPGNVRELRNVLQKAVALSGNGTIHARHIQFDSMNEEKSQTATRTPISAGNPASPPVVVTPSALSIEEMEIRHICGLLEHHGGHRRTVADILGISERTLYRKLNRYGLHPAKD